MANKFHARLNQENTSSLRKFHDQFGILAAGNLLKNCSVNDVANSAFSIGIKELAKRHKIKLS